MNAATKPRRRLFGLNPVGMVLWALAAGLLCVFWVQRDGGLGDWAPVLAVLYLLLSLVGGVRFLIAAARDRSARAANCGGSMGILFMFIIAGAVGGTLRNSRAGFEVERETNQMLMALNQTALELEAYQSRVGRLPNNDKEVAEALHGKPMPCHYKNYRPSYYRDGDDDYRLNCCVPYIWGHGWGWIFQYYGPASSRRLQAILF
jgi:hypothetical protein